MNQSTTQIENDDNVRIVFFVLYFTNDDMLAIQKI